MPAVVGSPVTVRAPAKVNLHLAVGERRDDGYHELVSVFHALSLVDEVTVAPADELSVLVTGEGAADVPTDAGNLAWRAAVALAEATDREPDVTLSLAKGIPVAGGMAGGSADAAATLVALAALWRLDTSRDELAEIGATLGSDVPFALLGGTAIGTGRGEALLPVLGRRTFHWVLALAEGGLSTPAVYAELDRLREAGGAGGAGSGRAAPPRLGSHEPLMHALAAGDAAALAPLLGNDLQAAALSLNPRLRRTLRAGTAAGALAGIVSGSGPTCAFLCADAEAAVAVGAELAGAGVCRTVRVASGPVPGARLLSADTSPGREHH